MHIELSSLNPHVANAYRGQIAALLEKDPQDLSLSDSERRARALLEQQEAKESRMAESTRTFVSLGAALYIVGLYVDSYIEAIEPVVKLAVFLALVGVFAVAAPLFVAPERISGGRRALRRRCGVEEMRAVFPLILRSRAEVLYGDTLLRVAEADLDDGTRRDLLRGLNTLVDGSLQLEKHRRRVGDLIARGDGVAAIEAERDELARRREATDDPVARQAVAKSLELCDERLGNVRALEPMLGRLEAHQEVICQALLLVHSALARAQVTPAASAAPDVEEIHRIVTRISGQTAAVEQAVAEVTALRAG